MTALANNPNATAKDYAEIAAVLPPQQADSIRSTFKMMNEEKAKNNVDFTAQVFSALNSGQKGIAMDLVKKRAEGLRNTGQDQEASGWDTWSKIIDQTPQFAKDHYGILLSTMPEGEKAVKTALEFNKENKLAGMPADVRKDINTSVEQATSFKSSADRATDIADRFEQMNKTMDSSWWGKFSGSGSVAGLGEWLKSQGGTENDITQLRKDYVLFRTSEVASLLKNFKPASNSDVAMVMKGFLPETANAGQVASFLRGMAKVSKLQSEVESSKAEWIQSVGTLGKTSNDTVINGVTVPAGTNFMKYSGMLSQRMYIDGIAEDFKAGRIDEAKAKSMIEQAQKRKF
jgi:hypothetical protein